MYICWNCGSAFEEGEIKWAIEPHGEWTGCCPHCGANDVEEAKFCHICGKPFCEDDLTYGFCDECLHEALTFDTFMEYGLYGFKHDQFSLLEGFVFWCLYHLGEEYWPKATSIELREELIQKYVEKIKGATGWDKDYYQSDLEDFMKSEMSDFASWLEWKGVKKCTKEATEPNA